MKLECAGAEHAERACVWRVIVMWAVLRADFTTVVVDRPNMLQDGCGRAQHACHTRLLMAMTNRLLLVLATGLGNFSTLSRQYCQHHTPALDLLSSRYARMYVCIQACSRRTQHSSKVLATVTTLYAASTQGTQQNTHMLASSKQQHKVWSPAGVTRDVPKCFKCSMRYFLPDNSRG